MVESISVQRELIDIMEQDVLEIKILNLATFLHASPGIHLIGTKRLNGEVFFIFSPKADAEKLLESYFTDKALVNPKELFAKLNDLRDLIFSGGKNG